MVFLSKKTAQATSMMGKNIFKTILRFDLCLEVKSGQITMSYSWIKYLNSTTNSQVLSKMTWILPKGSFISHFSVILHDLTSIWHLNNKCKLLFVLIQLLWSKLYFFLKHLTGVDIIHWFWLNHVKVIGLFVSFLT